MDVFSRAVVNENISYAIFREVSSVLIIISLVPNVANFILIHLDYFPVGCWVIFFSFVFFCFFLSV